VLRGGTANSSGIALATGGATVQMLQQTAQAIIDSDVAVRAFDSRSEQIKAARLKGYEGDSCGECGNFTLVRNGTCMKCNTCGATSGCS
jgi:ribonucleoside-diphosphate reductase alpha chain